MITKEQLNISSEDIDIDLSSFYSIIYTSNSTLPKVLKKWGSVESYVDILYWLKFKKKLSYTEMINLTGDKNIPQYYFYASFGWHYSTNNFEECMKLFEADKTRLAVIANDAAKLSDSEMTPEHKAFLKDAPPISRTTYKNFGYTDSYSLTKDLYYFLIVAQLSVKEISILLNKTLAVTKRTLKIINLRLTINEAQQRASTNGNRNYTRIFETGKKAIINQIFETGLTGSNAENICRTKLNMILSDYLDINIFEYIVGVGNRTIIHPYEVDIPVVVLNKKRGSVYKFAIEFNGDIWHAKSKEQVDKDKQKESFLKQQKWIYIPIDYTSNSKTDVNSEHFNSQLSEVCLKIQTVSTQISCD